MKYIHIYTLFLMLVFYSSYGQSQTNVPQDNISKGLYSESQIKEAETTRVPTGMVRHVKKARNGDILIASYLGVFRYDGTSFTNLTGKLISPRFSSFWNGKTFNNIRSIIEDKKGRIWFGNVDGLWRSDGSTFTKVSQRGAYAIIEDTKGNIWTTGEVNPQVWALSRYDAKSLYNKMPAVTEIKSGGIMGFLGIVEANDGSIWFGAAGPEHGVHRYDGKTTTHFKSKEGQNL